MDKPKIGAVSPVLFLKEVKSELLKVSFPSKDDVIKLTSIVIAVSLAVGVFIGMLDYTFTNLMTIIVKR